MRTKLAEAARADAYLIKPIAKEPLVAKIREFLPRLQRGTSRRQT